jgi:hypothetical protein
MAKFLGETDLVYLWSKIKNHVSNAIAGLSSVYQAKESGKGLSTNDYTTAEKNKLGGIASGAEVNVQANWAEGNSSSDAYIQNKPTIPSKTSDLTNDSGYITSTDVPEGAAASTVTPIMDGTASKGTDNGFARGDHVHPTDTSRAPLASPALTGTPTAPTANAGTSTTQIATTEFVTNAVATASAGLASFQGTVATASTITGSAYKKGWYWVVTTAGTYVGQTCEVGDMIFAIKDKGSAYAASDFSVVQNNMDLQEMTTLEMDTATDNWA